MSPWQEYLSIDRLPEILRSEYTTSMLMELFRNYLPLVPRCPDFSFDETFPQYQALLLRVNPDFCSHLINCPTNYHLTQKAGQLTGP